MFLDYISEELEKISFCFFNATGVDMLIFDRDFNQLDYKKNFHNTYCRMIQECEEGLCGCMLSDKELLLRCKETKKPQIHTCHAGLIDIAVPIVCENSVLGYIMLGQIKNEKHFNEIKKNFPSSIDTKKLKEHYDMLPYFNDIKIESITNIATMLANYLFTQNMLSIKQNKNFEDVFLYINENFDKKLTVESISKATNVSKTTLYSIFHSQFNCTVNDFINRKRVNESIKLLINTDLSIEDISYRCGFSSTAYYSKVFKKIVGKSPLRFRKSR